MFGIGKFAKEIKEEGACGFSFVIGLSVCMILLCYMNPRSFPPDVGESVFCTHGAGPIAGPSKSNKPGCSWGAPVSVFWTGGSSTNE